MKLFALATTMSRNNGQTTTLRTLLGYRRAETPEAAIGSFVLGFQKDPENGDFSAGEIVIIEIKLPASE